MAKMVVAPSVLNRTLQKPEVWQREIFAQTFGRFDIFTEGHKLEFQNSLSKELLALLIDRCGEVVTPRDVFEIMIMSKGYKRYNRTFYSNSLFKLSCTLKKENLTPLLVVEEGGCRLDTSKLSCDYYGYLSGDEEKPEWKRNEYMPCYTWAQNSFREKNR